MQSDLLAALLGAYARWLDLILPQLLFDNVGMLRAEGWRIGPRREPRTLVGSDGVGSYCLCMHTTLIASQANIP